jgi:hypothetical protein
VTCRSDRLRRAVVCVALLAAAGSSPARAADPDPVQKARAEFVAATDHVKNARWGEALAAFERSAALRPHALTTYNIGACERALGRYTRARATLQRALDSDDGTGKRELPKSFADDARRWIAEIDGILVRASVTLSPADATLLVDGAPLTPEQTPSVLTAGLPPGAHPVTTPGSHFTLIIDPGEHIFALSRAGFANAVVSRSLAPSSKPNLTLDLQSLPALIRIAANRPGAVVTIDDLDTGVAPVEVSRPAGVYHVTVRKSGFVPYVTTVRVSPGDHPSLQASLVEETSPIYKKFWFWAGAAAVVGGATVGTYFLTRPAPERPAPDGGGLGWVVTVPAPGSR